ncbi:hypothetical protein BDF21DRAFT_403390 [Thamnidium elegans]|nr:hypothetical protein BDF21DRAFT_403390 [Thamnidium elegans]
MKPSNIVISEAVTFCEIISGQYSEQNEANVADNEQTTKPTTPQRNIIGLNRNYQETPLSKQISGPHFPHYTLHIDSLRNFDIIYTAVLSYCKFPKANSSIVPKCKCMVSVTKSIILVQFCFMVFDATARLKRLLRIFMLILWRNKEVHNVINLHEILF